LQKSSCGLGTSEPRFRSVITLLVAMQGPAAKVWSSRITLRQLISDYHDPPSATSSIKRALWSRELVVRPNSK
jgi:hypothetical protein